MKAEGHALVRLSQEGKLMEAENPGFEGEGTYIILDCELTKEEGLFVARCPKLKVSDSGKTADEATANLRAALSLFFDVCIKRGTLPQVLREAGMEPRPAPFRQEIMSLESLMKRFQDISDDRDSTTLAYRVPLTALIEANARTQAH